MAVGVLALLAGCGQPEDKGAGIPLQPKWKGAPYRIAFDTQAEKASSADKAASADKTAKRSEADKKDAAGITIPLIRYTANPEALEKRALLVMRFSAPPTGPAAANQEPVMHRMIGSPVDIPGEEGKLPADYMDRVNKGLAEYLDAYCIEGKVSLNVALARSSLNPQGGDADVNAKRLSDWLPLEGVYKRRHGKKC